MSNSTEPTERVEEYLRQYRLRRGASETIHGIHTDVNAEMANLTVDDLADVLELAQRYEDLCD